MMTPTPRTWLGPLLGLLLMVSASPAAAQFYVQTETSSVFVSLASRPDVSALTDFAFSSADDGTVTLPIPFSFDYLGNPYTDVRVGTNGLLVFGGGYFGGYTNYPIGDYWSPNNMIAVWWDDLVLPAASGHSSHGILGVAPNRIFVIEVRDWEHYSLNNNNDGRYQVWLYEGGAGRFEVRYDRALTDTNYSATAGWEGSLGDGEPNGVFRPCSTASPYCDADDYATLTGRVFAVERAQGPELLGAIGSFGRGTRPGQSVNVPVTLENQGTEIATNVTHELYLSTDALSSPATDIRVASFITAALAPNGGRADLTVPATVPPGTPDGDYYLILVVDAPDAVPEVSEQNNVVVAAERFATAYEFTPVQVVVPAGARPGQPLQVDLTIEDLGASYSGPLAVEVLASIDRNLDINDTSLGVVNAALNGQPQQSVSLTYPVPQGLAPGRYYAIARLDPQAQLPQLDVTNDVRISDDAFPTAQDLVPTSVTGPAGAAPGSIIQLNVVVENQGLDHAGPVGILAIASIDPIYDLNDPVLGQVSVDLTLATGASQLIPLTLTVPALRPANYYPIVVIDPARLVPEANDYNNTRVADTTFASGPDLVITDVVGPAEAAPGDPVTFSTRIGSIGAPYPGSATYALYLSDDEVLDVADVPLGLFTAVVGDAPEVLDVRNFTFPSIAPGTYSLLAVVDPGDVVAEADETNNDFSDRNALSSGPDFRIFSVFSSPDEVDLNDVVQVTGTLYNYGTPFFGDVPYRIVLSDGFGLDPADLTVSRGAVPMNGETSLTLTATFSIGQAGVPVPPRRYRVYVEIDPDNVIPEQNDTANFDDSSRQLTLRGPNPIVSIIDSSPIAFIGQPYYVRVGLANDEPVAAVGVEVELYLSGVGVLLEGRALGRTPAVTVPAGGGRTVTATITIPSDVTPGWYLFGGAVDPDGVILETNERDNLVLRPGGVTVMAPSADVYGRIVDTATVAAPGEGLAITRLITNDGVADTPSFDYQYVLSLDDQIGPEDLVIATASTTLAQSEAELSIDLIELPWTVPAGRYRIGLVLDPAGTLAEVDETNNASLGPWIDVVEPDLRILTTELPVARVGLPYEAGLFAVGGSQSIRWSLVSGVVPAGLNLDAASGRLSGVIREEGLFTFTVAASAGGPVAQVTLQLRVISATVPLRLATLNLPAGVAGRAYDGQLLAVGGVPPYRFTALSPMPTGLALDAEGRLTGVPTLSGTTVLLVRVEDALGEVASGEVVVRVVRPDHQILITQSPLPSARVDAEYCQPEDILLFASGGTPPYRWTVDGDPTPGLVLAENGALCGTPRRAGRFTILVRVADAAGAVDTSAFILDVLPADAFAISSTSLPDGAIEAPYEAALAVAGSTEPTVWTLAQGDLPPGLEFGADGRITGIPTAAGLFPFLVRVEDGRGQARRQPLSIRVIDPNVSEDGGGCVCVRPAERSGGGWALFGLLGVLLIVRRRR